MKLAAVICEYNPFHSGHKFHIEETRKNTGADAVVAIMSGNFVQRGDVAIFDKHVRAQAAILGGADLVIALPTAYSSASAEFFALGAVKILNALGMVDFLSFGAESADLGSLLKIARLLSDEPPLLAESIKKFMSSGLPYPTSRSLAVGGILGTDFAEILATPNNILGIEYCKALIKTDSSIAPCPILRRGAEHDSREFSDGIASATYIRELLLADEFDTAMKFVPSALTQLYKNAEIHSLKALDKAILAHIIKMPTAELKNIPDVAEGLENRIKAAALEANTINELIDRVKTKRYTHSRLRRIVLSAYLGTGELLRKEDPRYIHILAHNEVGQKIIANAKRTASLPIVRNTSQVNKLCDPLVKAIWERERVFDKLYDLTKI